MTSALKKYSVPDMSCGHCKTSIEGEVSKVAGVSRVEVNVDARTVEVEGDPAEAEVFAAIAEAGYEVAGAA